MGCCGFRAVYCFIVFAAALCGQQPGILTTLAGGGPFTVPVEGGVAPNTTLFSVSAVAVSPKGNVYFAMGGSSIGPQLVAEILDDGHIKVVAGGQDSGFAGDGGTATKATLNFPGSLAFDTAGNLYIADAGNHRIRRITADGVISTYAGSGQAAYSGDGGPATRAALNGPGAITVDRSGNLIIADTLNHVVRKVTPAGVISTVAGTGKAGFSGGSGPARQVPLNTPLGVAVNSKGEIYIADTLNYLIRKVVDDTSTIVASVYSDGLGSHFPFGLAFDSSDNLYMALSLFETRIVKRTPAGLMIPVAGMATPPGYVIFGSPFCCDGVSGTSALISPQAGLNTHTALAVDAANNLYIADIGFDRIRKLNAAGIISTVAGNSFRLAPGDGGPATDAFVGLPLAVAVDRTGSVLFAEGNHTVRKVSPSGQITRVAGTGAIGSDGDGGPATLASLSLTAWPVGLATDSGSNIYIADVGNNRIRKVDRNGTISTFAGNGQQGFSGDGGPAVVAALSSPTAVAADSKGNVYLAEGGRIRRVAADGTIRTFASGQGWTALAVDSSDTVFAATYSTVDKFATDGSFTRVAGNGQVGFQGNGGPATQASLNTIRGIAIGAGGVLYIADSLNNWVRAVGPDGIIRVLAGTGTAAFKGDGGPAASASLKTPFSVAADSNGNVYIADTFNSRIRKFTPLPGLTFTAAGLVNAASFQAGSIAREEIVSWFGATQVAGVFQPPADSLAFELGGLKVKLKDSAGEESLAPISLVAPGQVNFNVPYLAPNGPATLTVQAADGRSATVQTTIASTAPGIFTANANGRGVPAGFAIHAAADGSQTTEPLFKCDAGGACVPSPLAFGAGEQIVLTLFGTGIRHYGTPVTATVGGVNAPVLFADSQGTYLGLDQVNLAVPSALAGSGTVDVILTVDGRSANTVQIAIQ